PEVAGDGQVPAVHRAEAQVVAARLEAEAAVGRPGEDVRVEHPVPIARAAAARIAVDDDARSVVRRAGEVHVGTVDLVLVGRRVGGAGTAGPDARQLPVVGHGPEDVTPDTGTAVDARNRPREVGAQ